MLMLCAVVLIACREVNPKTFETVAVSNVNDAGALAYQDPRPAIQVITGRDDIFLSPFPRLLIEKNIDYTTSFAILVLRGNFSAGSTVSIESVERNGTTIVVHADFHDPKSEDYRPSMIASPYHLIAVSKKAVSLDDVYGRTLQFILLVDNKQVAVTTHHIP